jgi:Rhodopirellula transposase DDE domain
VAISPESRQGVDERWNQCGKYLDEYGRRLFAGAEAKALGHGGIAAVATVTGMSVTTIRAGLQEIASRDKGTLPGRVRRSGGGRKSLLAHDPALLHDLEALVESTTRGDPESPLRWTCKSLRNLAEELAAQGHHISHVTVGEVLKEHGYTLQADVKCDEGSSHPDRNAQFEHIHTAIKAALRAGTPVISVDAKKKELVGAYKNAGREWHEQGKAPRVKVYDFVDRTVGRATPYGVYDVGADSGWVSVGSDHDTAEFAVESIERWWRKMGNLHYPHARELVITADSGGSNGYRVRLWKQKLQEFADTTGLTIRVHHFPPGTSKWNKVEHSLFSRISLNWRGKPLVSHEVIVQLIAHTTTKSGLRVSAERDDKQYAEGIKVSDQQFQRINLQEENFHGEWNYSILPRY